MALVVRIDFSHKLLDLIITHLLVDIFMQHCSNFCNANNIPIFFVKYMESLFSFVVATAPCNPSVCNHMLAEGEVDAITFLEFWIAFLEVCIRFTLAQSVEAEVVQNIPEVRD